MNRTRLLVIGAVALALGAAFSFFVYQRLQAKMAPPKVGSREGARHNARKPVRQFAVSPAQGQSDAGKTCSDSAFGLEAYEAP